MTMREGPMRVSRRAMLAAGATGVAGALAGCQASNQSNQEAPPPPPPAAGGGDDGDPEDGAPVASAADVAVGGGLILRSEEHTSELQSRENLVCRLLLEKK